MKTIAACLSVFFFLYMQVSLFQGSQVIQSKSQTLSTQTVQSQCCCKGHACSCSSMGDSGCQVKEVKVTHSESRQVVIKGLGCGDDAAAFQRSSVGKSYQVDPVFVLLVPSLISSPLVDMPNQTIKYLSSLFDKPPQKFFV